VLDYFSVKLIGFLFIITITITIVPQLHAKRSYGLFWFVVASLPIPTEAQKTKAVADTDDKLSRVGGMPCPI
jgi:hypothetical protein